ncbi:MAG: asparaginase, partial [Planctomycetaceae bacterium]|nr:asparaginase [Planctomycetaceae bacterium]
RVHVIGTGGTISFFATSRTDYVDYTYGTRNLTIEEMLARVPETRDLARVTSEQLVNVASTDIGPEHWLELARRIDALHREDSALAGVVITHGTDTLEDTAFFLWAGEPDLNGRADGCAVDILEPDGRLLSRFDIDVPPRSWLPEPPPAGDGVAMERLPGRKGAAGRSWFVGTAPVHDGEGTLLGSVRLMLPAASSSLPQGPRPEILRNYGGSRAPPGGRAIHRAVFDGDVLRECTHPDWPRGMRAPAAAVEAVLQRGEPLLWVHEEVAGRPYHDAYLPRVEEGRVTGLLSVGFPSLTARPLLLNLSKVGFLHLLAAAALGAVAGGAALLRGRARLPSLGFRAKVIAGFVLVGATPVVGLALLDRSLARERTAEAMEREVVESLRLVEGSLRDAGVLDALVALAEPGGPPVSGEEAEARIPDDTVKEIAYRAGVPVNLFLGDSLLASSERGIFATELFSPRLTGPACAQVVLLGRGAFSTRERFGSFSFLTGYAPVRGPGGAVAGVIAVPLLYRQDRADRDLARTTTAALALYLLV